MKIDIFQKAFYFDLTWENSIYLSYLYFYLYLYLYYIYIYIYHSIYYLEFIEFIEDDGFYSEIVLNVGPSQTLWWILQLTHHHHEW